MMGVAMNIESANSLCYGDLEAVKQCSVTLLVTFKWSWTVGVRTRINPTSGR